MNIEWTHADSGDVVVLGPPELVKKIRRARAGELKGIEILGGLV